jgi:hypothetical protein
MSMYFYDDTDDWPEYKIIKDEIHRLEMAHSEFRKKLQEVSSALVSDPEKGDVKAQVDRRKKKLGDRLKKDPPNHVACTDNQAWGGGHRVRYRGSGIRDQKTEIGDQRPEDLRCS